MPAFRIRARLHLLPPSAGPTNHFGDANKMVPGKPGGTPGKASPMIPKPVSGTSPADPRRVAGRVAAEKERICRTCRYLVASEDGRQAVCLAPCPICPRDDRRRQPWLHMPRCPANLWPT